MPELPEVETVARDLNQYLPGQIFSSLRVLDQSKKFLDPSSAIIRKKIIGQKITKVYRRAKLVIIETKTHVLLFHLKMTGQLIYVDHKPLVVGGHPIVSTGITVPNKFTRIIFKFASGSTLYFNDVRRFGWIKLMTQADFFVLNKSLGLEPLSQSFTLDFFKKLVEGRKISIKAVLLDQKKLVGLGNIYVDEVLFKSRIRPDRRAIDVKPAELKRLWQAIPVILRQAIKQRGTTFSNFLDSAGYEGNFIRFLKVYGRGQKKCLVCGRALKKTRVAGRGTHWCAHCQT